jgi:Ca2+/H+ antiporter
VIELYTAGTVIDKCLIDDCKLWRITYLVYNILLFSEQLSEEAMNPFSGVTFIYFFIIIFLNYFFLYIFNYSRILIDYCSLNSHPITVH